MPLLPQIIFSATGPGILRQFHDHCREPLNAQRFLLTQILRKNADTAFGRKHKFSRISSFDEFQESVPTSSYDDLSPYIEASLKGEGAQLTVEKPILFAKTSGTTGAAKFIPVTPESRSSKSQLMRVWLSALYRDHPSAFSGRILTVVSPEVESYAPCGIPCGSESGHGYKNVPRALKSMYSAPYEVYELKSYEAKYYTLLRVAAEQKISLIYTCNPSTVELIAKLLCKHTEKIIRDVRDGTLATDLEIPESFRSLLAKQLKPNPRQAAFLEEAVKKSNGELLPGFVWPHLAVIGCWKGGTVGMYLERFDRYFPPGLPVRDIGYFASEHRGSVPMADEGSAGVLAVPTNVYEFLPADEEKSPGTSKLLTVDQLETGKQYFVYVTTAAGLHRYDMNDIIEVTGIHEKTPLVRFVQKGKGVVNFTGEKLSETQVLAAVQEAFSFIAGRYEFIAAVGGMWGDKPGYEFLVEFDENLKEADTTKLLNLLENALRRHNLEYAAKRDSLRLASPVLRVIKPGEFERYRKRVIESGKKTDGQFKILRLFADPAFAKEFEALQEISLNSAP